MAKKNKTVPEKKKTKCSVCGKVGLCKKVKYVGVGYAMECPKCFNKLVV